MNPGSGGDRNETSNDVPLDPPTDEYYEDDVYGYDDADGTFVRAVGSSSDATISSTGSRVITVIIALGMYVLML